ncbi:MAG TPA: glycosyltransferase [Pseudoxanthomonas sp.]|nr:MAG: hypothetical protein ABS98_04320 [Xanthomonadaceae bacterium SCN 69-48]
MKADAGQGRQTVLIVASTYPRWPGDGEPGFVHELARRLVDKYRVVVLAPNAPGAKRRENMDDVEIWRYRYAPRRWETLVHGGGMLQQLRKSPWKWLLLPTFAAGQVFAVSRALRLVRPALIHAHWSIPQGVLVAIARELSFSRVPLGVTSHGADVMGLSGSFYSLMRRWLRRQCAFWTVVGPALAERLVRERVGRSAADFPMIPMGVDLFSRFTRDGKPQARDINQVLYVGRLVPGKGLDVLVDAMKLVRQRHPDARLLLVGDGPLKQALKGRIAKLDLDRCVQFAGSLGNAALPPVYRRACVHAAPFTLPQGFGLTLIESVGCGCPVVTTPFSAAPNIGIGSPMVEIVDAGDVPALANALSDRLGGEPPEWQMEGAIATLRDRYDWRVVTENYRAQYRMALREAAA